MHYVKCFYSVISHNIVIYYYLNIKTFKHNPYKKNWSKMSKMYKIKIYLLQT